MPVLIILELTEDAVPLVYDDDKGAFGIGVNIRQAADEVGLVKIHIVRIKIKKFPEHRSFQQLQEGIHIAGTAEEVLHVELDDIIFIAMLIKILRPGDFQARKGFAGIHRTVIIGSHHAGGHGFAEASRTADTKVFPAGQYYPVGIVQQACFVHVNFGVDCLPE